MLGTRRGRGLSQADSRLAQCEPSPAFSHEPPCAVRRRAELALRQPTIKNVHVGARHGVPVRGNRRRPSFRFPALGRLAQGEPSPAFSHEPPCAVHRRSELALRQPTIKNMHIGARHGAPVRGNRRRPSSRFPALGRLAQGEPSPAFSHEPPCAVHRRSELALLQPTIKNVHVGARHGVPVRDRRRPSARFPLLHVKSRGPQKRGRYVYACFAALVLVGVKVIVPFFISASMVSASPEPLPHPAASWPAGPG